MEYDHFSTCSNCEKLRTEIEITRETFALNFSTLKKKIISTDLLIRDYAVKTQEYNAQSKKLENATRLVEQLQRDCVKYESELSRVLQEVEPLREERETLVKSNQAYVKQLSTLQETVCAAEKVNEQYLITIKEHQVEKCNLKEKVEALKKSLAKVNKESSKTKRSAEEAKDWKIECQNVNKELTQLKKKFSRCKKHVMVFGNRLVSKKLLSKREKNTLDRYTAEASTQSSHDSENGSQSDSDCDADGELLEKLVLENGFGEGEMTTKKSIISISYADQHALDSEMLCDLLDNHICKGTLLSPFPSSPECENTPEIEDRPEIGTTLMQAKKDDINFVRHLSPFSPMEQENFDLSESSSSNNSIACRQSERKIEATSSKYSANELKNNTVSDLPVSLTDPAEKPHETNNSYPNQLHESPTDVLEHESEVVTLETASQDCENSVDSINFNKSDDAKDSYEVTDEANEATVGKEMLISEIEEPISKNIFDSVTPVEFSEISNPNLNLKVTDDAVLPSTSAVEDTVAGHCKEVSSSNGVVDSAVLEDKHNYADISDDNSNMVTLVTTYEINSNLAANVDVIEEIVDFKEPVIALIDTCNESSGSEIRDEITLNDSECDGIDCRPTISGNSSFSLLHASIVNEHAYSCISMNESADANDSSEDCATHCSAECLPKFQDDAVFQNVDDNDNVMTSWIDNAICKSRESEDVSEETYHNVSKDLVSSSELLVEAIIITEDSSIPSLNAICPGENLEINLSTAHPDVTADIRSSSQMQLLDSVRMNLEVLESTKEGSDLDFSHCTEICHEESPVIGNNIDDEPFVDASVTVEQVNGTTSACAHSSSKSSGKTCERENLEVGRASQNVLIEHAVPALLTMSALQPSNSELELNICDSFNMAQISARRNLPVVYEENSSPMPSSTGIHQRNVEEILCCPSLAANLTSEKVKPTSSDKTVAFVKLGRLANAKDIHVNDKPAIHMDNRPKLVSFTKKGNLGNGVNPNEGISEVHHPLNKEKPKIVPLDADGPTKPNLLSPVNEFHLPNITSQGNPLPDSATNVPANHGQELKCRCDCDQSILLSLRPFLLRALLGENSSSKYNQHNSDARCVHNHQQHCSNHEVLSQLPNNSPQINPVTLPAPINSGSNSITDEHNDDILLPSASSKACNISRTKENVFNANCKGKQHSTIDSHSLEAELSLVNTECQSDVSLESTDFSPKRPLQNERTDLAEFQTKRILKSGSQSGGTESSNSSNLRRDEISFTASFINKSKKTRKRTLRARISDCLKYPHKRYTSVLQSPKPAVKSTSYNKFAIIQSEVTCEEMYSMLSSMILPEHQKRPLSPFPYDLPHSTKKLRVASENGMSGEAKCDKSVRRVRIRKRKSALRKLQTLTTIKDESDQLIAVDASLSLDNSGGGSPLKKKSRFSINMEESALSLEKSQSTAEKRGEEPTAIVVHNTKVTLRNCNSLEKQKPIASIMTELPTQEDAAIENEHAFLLVEPSHLNCTESLANTKTIACQSIYLNKEKQQKDSDKPSEKKQETAESASVVKSNQETEAFSLLPNASNVLAAECTRRRSSNSKIGSRIIDNIVQLLTPLPSLQADEHSHVWNSVVNRLCSSLTARHIPLLASKLSNWMSACNSDLMPELQVSKSEKNANDGAILGDTEKKCLYLVKELKKKENMQDIEDEICSEILRLTIDNNSTNLGRASLCRFYISLCKLQENADKARVFCYDVIYHAKKVCGPVMVHACRVWPHIFHCSENSEKSLLKVFLFTLNKKNSIIGFSKEFTASSFLLNHFNLNLPQTSIKELTSCLVKRLKNDDQGQVFETVKALELLGKVEGWKWTNNYLIREELWPILQSWSQKPADDSEIITDSAMAHCLYLVGGLTKQSPAADKTSAVEVLKTMQSLLLKSLSVPVAWCVQEATVMVILMLLPYDKEFASTALQSWISNNEELISSALRNLLSRAEIIPRHV